MRLRWTQSVEGAAMCGRFVQSLTAVEYLEALRIDRVVCGGGKVGNVRNEGSELIRPENR